MLVRLVEEYRRADVTYPPGVLLDVPRDEAVVLWRAGVAVPSTRLVARETRQP